MHIETFKTYPYKDSRQHIHFCRKHNRRRYSPVKLKALTKFSTLLNKISLFHLKTKAVKITQNENNIRPPAIDLIDLTF